MSRTLPVTRLVTALALGAAGALATVPAGPVLQAVVSYDGSVTELPGVQVVGTLDTLHVAVVRGKADALARLPRVAGVRGVAPDAVVELTGSKDSGSGSGVLASEGLGGRAGKKGAGAGVRVALVDTGVSDTEALTRASGRLVDAADASVAGSVTADGGPLVDGFGHGTYLASVLAGGPVEATGGKALGVAPGATVLVVRVADPEGTTSLSRVLGGLDWIAGHADQVDVANLALSYQRPHEAYGPDPLTDAVEQVRAAGVTVVVASGNSPDVVGDPGFDPRVLTVGAADVKARTVAPFSGSAVVHGVAKPDVVANGVSVLGLLPPGSVIAQLPGTAHLANGLSRGSGTSQATAVTSGLAALLLARHPEATPTQVKASLRCTADDLRGSRDGAGLVRTSHTLCSGPDGAPLGGGSGDPTGEAAFDANAWAANAWAANAWAANAWAANAWASDDWGTER